MYSTKTLMAAAALAASSVAGLGAASAQPNDNRMDMRDHRPVVVERRVVVRRPIIVEHRVVVERPVVVRRPYVDRIRMGEILRVNHYEVIGEPMFVRGHYVVRTHNRFGHVVFVQIDPYSGAFQGEIRL